MAVASHRAGLGYDWKTTGSLPPAYLAQALLPWGLLTVGGWRSTVSEYYLYPGVLPLVLAIHALARRWDWRVGFHAVLGLGAVLLAFGDHFGLYRPAYDLVPGLTLFRIPARFVGLAGFAVAVLAGLGAEALVTGPRPHRLARESFAGSRWSAAVGVVPLTLVLVWAQAQPNRDDFQNFANQYLLLVLLVAGLGARGQLAGPGGAARARGRGAGRAAGRPPVRLVSRDRHVAEPRRPVHRGSASGWTRSAGRPEPLRLSRADRIHPTTIYRHGWGVVDGESTFAPPAFLDLFALSREHPPLLDLLNVRYVLPAGAALPAPAKPAGALRVWPGAVRRLHPPAGPARQIEIHTHLVHGLEIPPGAGRRRPARRDR